MISTLVLEVELLLLITVEDTPLPKTDTVLVFNRIWNFTENFS